MNEYKFRSWIEPLKRMVYYSFGDYVERQYFFEDDVKKECPYWEPGIERAGTDYPESELKKHRMQFIGRKDEDGKEIYTEDIIDFCINDVFATSRQLGRVFYKKEDCGFIIKRLARFDNFDNKWKYNNCGFVICFNPIYVYDGKPYNIKVVGNPMENPELLEELEL